MQVLQLQAPVPDAVALQDKAVHVPGRLLQLCFCGRRVVLVDGTFVVQVAFAQQLDRDGPAQLAFCLRSSSTHSMYVVDE